ncbi:uncharacterized protein SPAPADRAFT_149052 [Spathaspora passalidarum NRRL Y-27907]|uniref:DNA replication regulator SLD2 n=1 Tax=Spathaspora passalidarum (strain NRRL Y-27907 / 11-Y1) TaxID=619300 RepID=G3AI16_SPAPN|nr:uncharacterized protein SPAPADRAFT_149052 [Spathaspora passalidarum NRRL Y-27907]EGW34330.1 hypothetical protein SPAPADRAFT_149052 [Spathaspora passalidarum NRRL Y-27907]
MDITELKRKIKNWEHEFQKKNNRLPSKSDVKGNPEISKLYSLYKTTKSGKTAVPSKPPQPPPQSPHKPIPASPGMELGPTPQANGKVLSIFDYRMTPPESSPLKRKSTITEMSPARQNMGPPESPIKKIQMETPTKPKVRQLNFVTPTKKPTKINFETPDYLSHGVRALQQDPTTPASGRKLNFAAVFSVSPSPLKINRFGKKLADVYNASVHEMDMEIPEMSDEEHSEEDVAQEDEDGTITTYRKKKTQKRSTRRSKLAPVFMDQDAPQNVNVQEEMTKIEQQEKKRLASYINSDVESEEEESNVFVDTTVKKTRKPVADNYKRLKINDARSRHFKRRMRR